MKKPVVFVVGARGIPNVEGGVEKNTERLFPLIVAAGWRVVLAGLSDNIKSDSYRGVELRGAPRSKILKTDKLIYYVFAVFMALKLKPDVVHMQGLGSAIMLWAYKLMGAKTVVRYGLADYLVGKWGPIGKFGFLVAEYQLRWADAVIAVTPALADRLEKRGISRNVHVIGNAIDSRDAFELDGFVPPAAPYVLAVGRVTAQKNIDTLIKGFTQFAAGSAGDIRLVVAGGLDDTDYVESLQPLLTDRVDLIGRQPRSGLGALYAGAGVYVNSSVHEGASNAVLEAISFGCPTLLSGIPENRDFGLPEKHYFDPQSPDDIARALAAALADPKGYVADLSNFLTWDQVAQRTMAIYERLGVQAARQRPSEQAA